MSEAPTPAELRARYRLPEDDDALLAECDVTFFRASGPGGQHRNTTLTAVRLHHRPSDLVLIGKRERSQSRNLSDAVKRLRRRLEVLLTPPKPRKKTRPTAASREKRLVAKQRKARLKRQRGSGGLDSAES